MPDLTWGVPWLAAFLVGVGLLFRAAVREESKDAERDAALAAERAARDERAARAALAPPRNVIPLPGRRR